MENSKKEEKMKVIVKTDELLRRIKRQDLTQRDLAKILGISVPYLCLVLKNKKPCGPKLRKKLREYFGVLSFDDLFEIIE